MNKLRMVAIWVCIVQDLHVAVAAADLDFASVETDVGTFNGYVRRFKASGQELTVRRFLGIPFAEPPVGELRFKKPVRKAKLDGPYDATEYAPSCKQQLAVLGGKRKPGRLETMKTSEDCLYLNVFTPNTAGRSGNGLLPVMIYIHGGAYVFGSPQLYPHDVLVASGNVVAVTIAYRLSVWGYLSTGDEQLPGNYGLWDQHMAIQWVHENIEKFGGDPNSVTIYGSSAGGSSVVQQGMFPGNQGLIHRVIAQSGTATASFAVYKRPLEAATKLGELADCNAKTTKVLADCLKSKSSDELGSILNNPANNYLYAPWDFIPVVDNDFLPELPSNLFHGTSETAKRYQKAFADVDFMIGITDADGLITLTSIYGVPDPDAFEIDRERFESELVPTILRQYYGDDIPVDVLTRVVIGEYTNWTSPDDRQEALNSYIKLGSDMLFGAHVAETAKVHAKHSTTKSTYIYSYDFFPSQHLFPLPVWANKPNHLDEMTTVLGYDKEDGLASWATPYTDEDPEDWEVEWSQAHMKMWTNFARTGNPNGPAEVRSFLNTEWPRYDRTSERFMRLERHMSAKSVGERLLVREGNFWLNVLPGVIDAVSGRYAKPAETEEFCERGERCEP